MNTALNRRLILLLLSTALLAACAQDDPTSITDNPDTPWTETQYSLLPAQSCADVRDRVIDATTEEILQHRYSGGWFLEDAAPTADGGERGGGDEPTDYTTTNVQEEGVDETDIIKTDGTHIYTVNNGQLLILKSWPVTEAAILSRVDLSLVAEREAAEGGYSYTWSPGLFLYKDRVAAFSYLYSYDRNDPEARHFSGTRVTIVDVSDRSAPQVERRFDIEGWYTDARMIDGTVYLVSNSNLHTPVNVWDYTWEELPNVPDAQWIEDEAEREAIVAAARPHIRRLIADAYADVDINDTLPRQRHISADETVSEPEPLLACQHLYLPRTTAQLGVLNLTSFDLKAQDDTLLSSSLLARGWEVYASQDNLYVAMSSRWWWWGWGNQSNETHIHKFGLSGPTGRPLYAASGKVDGWLLNQFSMSEHRGFLRVASTDNEWTWNQATQASDVTGGNHLTILEQKAGQLVETGSVRNLAPGEQIFSARMMGERGYLVTFRQTDPLYTFDLSDPYDPKLLGELKINGFSSYMHPVGEGHLLTIGQDADDEGRVLGVHLQIFDVTDPTDPIRTFQEKISTGNWSSWSEAMWDHHAFTYHAGREVLAFPINIYGWNEEGGENFTGLLVYHASPEDGFAPIGRVNHASLVSQAWCLERYGDWNCDPENDYQWWTSMRRSVFIEDNVFALSDIGITVNDLYNPEVQHAAIVFQR